MVAVHSFQTEAISRGAKMLRTALGPAIATWLDDPAVVEVMLNPDGRLWVDRLAGGLADTGEYLSAADGERIVRLVAHHVGADIDQAQMACRPHVGVPAQASSGPRKDGAEFDGALLVACIEHLHQEGTAKILAG